MISQPKALALEVALALPAGLVGFMVGGALFDSAGQVLGAAAGILLGVVAFRAFRRTRSQPPG